MPKIGRFITGAALATALGLSTAGSAQAALVSLVSMQYSAAHPVPHLHYEGGTTAGDVEALRTVFDTFVKCREACLVADGGSTAVLTMSGPGGDYAEGLALADFLRENHIATVVERGKRCYSACAFAFLGGSGYSSQEGYGSYIDRMVEPGSIVGFHAPYRNEESFLHALNERGLMGAQGVTRDSLALMVKELVRWNVDPEVLFYMVGMGPDQTYDLTTAKSLYFARVALPPTPTASWITDVPAAVRNVCTRLIAIDERTDPSELVDRVPARFEPGIAVAEHVGPLTGFRLSNRRLGIGHCSITDASLETDGDYEIALYFNTMLTHERAKQIGYEDLGLAGPGVSFFNRQNGWSSAGTGGNMARRILQKGPMNHYFLPLDTKLDDLDLPGEAEIDKNRFVMRLYPLLPGMDDDLIVDVHKPNSRISHIGDVWVFEQVGPGLLLESAFLAPLQGRTISKEEIGTHAFLRAGTFDEDGTAFATAGFEDPNSNATAVVRGLVIKPDGGSATAADLATLQRLMCNVEFYGVKLDCSN